MNDTRTTVAALIAAALLAPTLAACSSPATAAPRDCEGLSPEVATAPVVAMLGQVGGTLAAYADDVAAVVDGAEATGARLIVNGVGDGDAPTLLVDVLMVGEGNNDLERDLDLGCKRDLVDAATEELGSATADTVDVFRALMALDGNLAGRSGGALDVALLTSLASDAAPVDLTDPAVLGDPVSALNTLAAAGLIPDCAGWRFHGLSTGRADDPALREFWRQYALRCGGALVAWTTHLTTFPGEAGPIAAADTEQIVVSEDSDAFTADLAGDVLFGPGSSALREAAAGALAELRDLASSTRGPILIVGHTDVGGVSEDDNLRLSDDRARAVTDWLIANGIDSARITTEGRGSREAIHPNPQTDEEHQANRRVVVTIGKD